MSGESVRTLLLFLLGAAVANALMYVKDVVRWRRDFKTTWRDALRLR